MAKTILFIEDEKEFSEIITSYLRKKGLKVKPVFQGIKGLREMEKSQYDLVILDLGLPDANGFQICQKLKERHSTPILILTAKDMIEDKVKGLNKGADDYLVKPVSLKELVARIKRLIKRNASSKNDCNPLG